MKALWRNSLKNKTVKNEMNGSKDIKDVPNISYSKAENQTTTMIRKDSCVIYVIIWKIPFKSVICVTVTIPIFHDPVSNIPIWSKVRVY